MHKNASYIHMQVQHDHYSKHAVNNVLDRCKGQYQFLLLRTVPAGDTCKPLHPIDRGGIIYSDLLLSPGVVANYVCEDGYSVHGNPSRTCAPDGSWIGNENGDPVTCEGI